MSDNTKHLLTINKPKYTTRNPKNKSEHDWFSLLNRECLSKIFVIRDKLKNLKNSSIIPNELKRFHRPNQT